MSKKNKKKQGYGYLGNRYDEGIYVRGCRLLHSSVSKGTYAEDGGGYKLKV